MTFRLCVAVLPSDYIGNDPEQAYFVDGLTADLVTDLSRFQSLHVVGPSHRIEWSGAILPAMPESGAYAPPRSAQYLVRGALRRTSARIRMTAQLEDAQSRVILWSGWFDRVFDVYFVGSRVHRPENHRSADRLHVVTLAAFRAAVAVVLLLHFNPCTHKWRLVRRTDLALQHPYRPFQVRPQDRAVKWQHHRQVRSSQPVMAMHQRHHD
jgi:TolB-like protein